MCLDLSGLGTKRGKQRSARALARALIRQKTENSKIAVFFGVSKNAQLKNTDTFARFIRAFVSVFF